MPAPGKMGAKGKEEDKDNKEKFGSSLTGWRTPFHGSGL